MEADANHLETWPATPEQLRNWARAWDEWLQAEQVSPEELLAAFARVRRSAQVSAAVEEWMLLAAREAGVRLQDLAEATAGHPIREQRRTYVTGPSDRIKRLRRDYGDASGRLAALLRATDPEQS